MSNSVYLESIEFNQFNKVKVTLEYGDATISGKLIDRTTRYIDTNGHTQDPYNVVRIEGYPFPLLIPYRAIRAEIEDITPGKSSNNPIDFDSDGYIRSYLNKWVRVNGLKRGLLIGHSRNEGITADTKRLEVKDTFYFIDGGSFVVNRSKEFKDD